MTDIMMSPVADQSLLGPLYKVSPSCGSQGVEPQLHWMSEKEKLTYTETHQYTSHQGQATQGINISTYVLCVGHEKRVRWGPLTN